MRTRRTGIIDGAGGLLEDAAVHAQRCGRCSSSFPNAAVVADASQRRHRCGAAAGDEMDRSDYRYFFILHPAAFILRSVAVLAEEYGQRFLDARHSAFQR